MKKLLTLALIVTLASCGQKQQEHHHDHDHTQDALSNNPNEVLLNEVDKIHDEAMGKLDDLAKAKTKLKKKLTESTNLTEEEKKEIEATIAQLDSANDKMFKWMHEFNPLPDSLGEEKAREYLEDEMERVKKVNEDIQEALDDAGKN